MKLRKGLGEKVLLKRIGTFNRPRCVLERGLGFYLFDFDRRGLYRKLGFSKTSQFAQMRFHHRPRKARELLRIVRALEELPQIDEAFSEGNITWSAVREISRVATRETEKVWLELSLNSSLRKIEKAVSRAQHGDRPPEDPYGLSHAKLKVIAELAIEDHALWLAAFDRVAANYGGELDAATVLLVLAKDYLEKPLNQQETEMHRVFQVVYHRCTECQRAWILTEDGPEGIPASKVAAREPLAQVVRLPVEASKVSAGAEAIGVGRAGLQKAVGDGVAVEQVVVEQMVSGGEVGAKPLSKRNGAQAIGESDQTRSRATSESSPTDPRGSSTADPHDCLPIAPRGSFSSGDPPHVGRNEQRKL